MALDDPFFDRGMTIHVTISGLQVAADIGVYAHEHGRAQPLVVDILLAIDAPAHDALQETIDYQRVADDAGADAPDHGAPHFPLSGCRSEAAT